MTTKFLHLCQDDKFIEFVQMSFDSVQSADSRFVVYGKHHTPQRPGYAIARDDTKFVGSSYCFSAEFLNDLNWCDAIVIHHMAPWAAYAALKAPRSVAVIWSGWGFDYYHLIKLPNGGVLPDTARLNTQKVAKKSSKSIGRVLKGLEKRAADFIYSRVLEKRIIARVDYFSAPIPDDWRLLVNEVQGFTAKYAQLNYGSVNTLFKVGPPAITGGDILIGNSASATNNHVEAFNAVAKLDLRGKRVVVPLSYGDAIYTEKIIKLGVSMFGDSFYPMTEFMTLNAYNEIISNCSIVVMNHLRQQALGNINIMLYKGAKLFLRPENPVFSFFKERGAIVHDVSEISRLEQSVFLPLSDEQVSRNRDVIDSFWADEIVINNIIQLAKDVSDGKGSVC